MASCDSGFSAAPLRLLQLASKRGNSHWATPIASVAICTTRSARPEYYFETFSIVCQVRVVMSRPKVFCNSVMNTGPFSLTT